MAPGSTATQTAVQTTAKASESTTIKAAERMDVFEQFDRIYHSIARRAFEIFSTSGGALGHDLEDWFKAESELLHPVHMNMAETEEAVTVRAEVPGFEAKNLEIKLEPRRLTISGKRETKEEKKEGNTVYHEHCADEILRIVDLPAEVDASKAEAKLRNGILEMQIPKGKSVKATRVQVKAG